MRKRLLTEVEGVVAAPVERVWRALLDDRPAYEMTTELGDHTVAYQGGWWYRGEWSVTAHPEGARVVLRVYNVADRLGWGVPLANRFFVGFGARTRQTFAEGLTALGERLGCPSRLLP
ncbi:hypothetical protein [Nonomuraea jiangxiensis]|uniref:Polyketide cyclase / dehydrase and lipid transport n=1 Tax=Nonomuraea jiangxiensis TaxID=633440 RepID=A0A1G9QHT8_9ACTN|nr:hypothetical protein [Nonomuraea jiangxiensis]SDM10612.1 hypothetical protein SAMN05421869_13639 [Nonomuraea jiangxiensis]